MTQTRRAVEPWVTELHAQLVDAGYDPERVEELISSSMERFRLSKFREFVPLLVERSVQRALRSDGPGPDGSLDRRAIDGK